MALLGFRLGALRGVGLGVAVLAGMLGFVGVAADASRARARSAVIADFRSFGDEGGGLVRLDLRSGRQRTVSSNERSARGGGRPLLAPTDVAVSPDGQVFATGQSDGPVVMRVVPRSGRQRLFATNRLSARRGGARALRSPQDLVVTKEGDLLVADDASGGTLIRVDRQTRRQRVIARGLGSRYRTGVGAYSRIRGMKLLPGGRRVAVLLRQAVISVDLRSGTERTLTSNQLSKRRGGRAAMYEPFSLEVSPQGSVFVGDNGRVVAVDRRGRQSVLAGDSGRNYLGDVAGLVLAPGGQLVFASSDPDAEEVKAQVQVIDLSSGSRRLVSTNVHSRSRGGEELLIEPRAVALLSAGELLVADVDEPSYVAPTAPGVIARVDLNTGRQSTLTSRAKAGVVAGVQQFESPTGVARERAGSLLVTSRFGAGDGSLLRIDPTTGVQSVVASNDLARERGQAELLYAPRGLTLAPDGSAYITVDPDVHQPRGAAIVRIDVRTGEQSLVASNALARERGGPTLLRRPAGILMKKDGELVIADTQAFDGEGGLIAMDPRTGRQRALTSNSISQRRGGSTPFGEPNAVVEGAAGRFYVTDRESRGAVIVVERSGAARRLSTNRISRRKGGLSALEKPRGIARIGARSLLVTDLGPTLETKGRVVRINTRTGKQTRVFTNRTSRRAHGPGLIANPSALVIEPRMR